MQLNVQRLVEACGDDSFEAGITSTTQLEPLAGSGAPVKPAIYAGNRYQVDRRYLPGRADPVEVISIDNVPSEANRLEAALEQLASSAGLPYLVLDLSRVGQLPPHVPKELTSFRFPHRQADAYLRDCMIDGMAFSKTDIGKSVFSATASQPLALLEWFPQSLLFGFWQSHLGKKASQAKLARSWVSEIIGVAPAMPVGDLTKTRGIKGDPLNLTTDDKVAYDEQDTTTWELLEGSQKAGGGKKKDSLAEIGHGQVPIPEARMALAAVSFSEIVQRSTVSFAGLRRVWVGDPDRNAAARGLLVSLGLLAHVLAFGRSFSLRSGAELRPTGQVWTWLGADGDEAVEPIDEPTARRLFEGCVSRAEEVGLPVGTRWPAPLVVQPGPELTKVIRSTYPLAG